jgi:hypothetical protein
MTGWKELSEGRFEVEVEEDFSYIEKKISHGIKCERG